MPSNMLTIRRRGQFVVSHTGSNANQCGLIGTVVLSYFVTIVSKDGRLNGQGFIIDNGAIQKYFDSTYKNISEFPSCEQMAQKACADFRKMFGKGTGNASKIYGLCVVITGLPGVAELECAWIQNGYETDFRVVSAMRPAMAM